MTKPDPSPAPAAAPASPSDAPEVANYFAEWRRRRDAREPLGPVTDAEREALALLSGDPPDPPPRRPRAAAQRRPELAAGTAEPARASRFYSAATLAGRPVPPRQWLVDELIPMSTVTLVGGDGGSGKSLLALQLAAAAASATGWLGRSVTAGPAIYMSAEDDDDELHRRLADITAAAGLRFEDLARLTIRSVAGECALLAAEPAGPLAPQLGLIQTALFEEIDRRAAVDHPGLIVIDTLADTYPANENDRAKVRQFVGLLRGLALRHRCAVVLLADPSLTGLNSGSGLSGSTAWNNSVRARLYLERVIQDGYEPDPDVRALRTMKCNYTRRGAEIALRWRAGVFAPEGAPEGIIDRLAQGAKAERVFLKLLRECAEQGRRVNHAGGPTYAPFLFAKHPGAEGVTKAGFRAAMEALLHRGEVVIREDGPPSHRRQFLEVKP